MSDPVAAPGGPSLTVIIPAFNEAENVPIVVEETLARLDADFHEPYEVLLVNDGSSDATPRVIDELAAKHAPRVRAVHNPKNLGFGGALRTGYTNARGDQVGYIPGDGEVTVDEVLRLYHSREGADLVLSSRARVNAPPLRRLLSWGFRQFTRVMLGFDPAGIEGLYLVRREALARFQLHSNTGLLQYEIAMRCFDAKLKVVKRPPIAVKPRLSGVSKVANLRTVARNLGEIVKLRLKR